jgi:signal transduction histidine kinase
MTGEPHGIRALAGAAETLAGELSLDTVLKAVVETAAAVTGCRYAALGVVGPNETISQFVTHGVDDDVIDAVGHYPTGKGLLGVLIRDPQIIRLDDIRAHPASVGFPEHHPEMTTFLGAPVRSGGRVYGNLYLTEKPGGFNEADEQLVLVLSAQAGAAIENALLSERLRLLAVQDERERISRDLHDGVIQALFSLGMSVESTRALVRTDPRRVEERLDAAVDAIDGAIRELRNYIFRLRPHEAATMGLRMGLAEVGREYEVNALVRPELRVPTDADARVPPRIVPDLLQIAREGLFNCAKHAHASAVIVGLEVHDDAVTLTVRDNGVGFVPGNPVIGRGLDNIRERAAALRGRVTIDSAPGEGTTLSVHVPLEVRQSEMRSPGTGGNLHEEEL